MITSLWAQTKSQVKSQVSYGGNECSICCMPVGLLGTQQSCICGIQSMYCGTDSSKDRTWLMQYALRREWGLGVQNLESQVKSQVTVCETKCASPHLCCSNHMRNIRFFILGSFPFHPWPLRLSPNPPFCTITFRRRDATILDDTVGLGEALRLNDSSNEDFLRGTL